MFQIYSARTAAFWRTCIGTISGAWSGDRGRDRANRDAIAITGCAATVCLVEYHYDLAPMVLQFGIDYRDWEVDNLLFTLMTMSLALLIFGYRRVRDLSQEMSARKLADGSPQPSLFRREAERKFVRNHSRFSHSSSYARS
jgi:hypothetical protein